MYCSGADKEHVNIHAWDNNEAPMDIVKIHTHMYVYMMKIPIFHLKSLIAVLFQEG